MKYTAGAAAAAVAPPLAAAASDLHVTSAVSTDNFLSSLQASARASDSSSGASDPAKVAAEIEPASAVLFFASLEVDERNLDHILIALRWHASKVLYSPPRMQRRLLEELEARVLEQGVFDFEIHFEVLLEDQLAVGSPAEERVVFERRAYLLFR